MLALSSSKPPSREEWLAIARRSPQATFFHTPFWHDLAIASTPRFRDGTRVLRRSGADIILPLLTVGSRFRGLLRRSVSTFAGCYGGPIASREMTLREQLDAQRAMVSPRTASLTLMGNVLAPDVAWLPTFELRRLSTRVLDLDGDFDRLLRGFSKGHKAAYTKGLRLGLRLRRATTATDVDTYTALYERSLDRWGERATSRYPRTLFAAIRDLSLREPKHVSMWLVEREAEAMAGGICFYWNKHVVYWHGVMDDRFHAESPSNVLVGEMIRDACEQGYSVFDFNPSGGHEQVEAFKRRFGTREITFMRGDYKSRPLAYLSRLRGGR